LGSSPCESWEESHARLTTAADPAAPPLRYATYAARSGAARFPLTLRWRRRLLQSSQVLLYTCPGGAIVKAFTCGACGKMSQVKDVKHDAGQTFLVCEHCSAEHTMRKVFGSPGVLPEVRAGPLRGAPRDTSDAE